jgi:hypothetical protein
MRRKMRMLDRKISLLDWSISVNRIVNPILARKQESQREKYDIRRRYLRLHMKGYTIP